MYEYEATLLSVVDGDTVDMELSLGLDAYLRTRLRLADVDTPELNATDPEVRARAMLAKQYVIDHLPVDRKALVIRTYKDRRDKYGRYLALIWGPGQELPINKHLVNEGLALPYSGGTRT